MTLEQQAIEHLLSASHGLLKICAELNPGAEAQLHEVYDHLNEVNGRLGVMKHRAQAAEEEEKST